MVSILYMFVQYIIHIHKTIYVFINHYVIYISSVTSASKVNFIPKGPVKSNLVCRLYISIFNISPLCVSCRWEKSKSLTGFLKYKKKIFCPLKKELFFLQLPNI